MQRFYTPVRFPLSVNHARSGMTAFDPLQRCSSYNQPTNWGIITVKHKAYLLRVSVPLCVSIGVTKRQRKGRANGWWGHEAPNIHLSPVKMRIVRSTQRTHLMHPSPFCFFFFFFPGTGSDSHLDCQSFYSPLCQPNRILDVGGRRLMIIDIERALLSDPCDPEP